MDGGLEGGVWLTCTVYRRAAAHKRQTASGPLLINEASSNEGPVMSVVCSLFNPFSELEEKLPSPLTPTFSPKPLLRCRTRRAARHINTRQAFCANLWSRRSRGEPLSPARRVLSITGSAARSLSLSLPAFRGTRTERLDEESSGVTGRVTEEASASVRSTVITR